MPQDILILDKEIALEDRRTTKKLQDFWNELRGDSTFPSSELVLKKKELIETIWEKCFLVEASNKSQKEDYNYKYVGSHILKAYGGDLTGYRVKNVAAIDPAHLDKVYEKLLATKQPVKAEGEVKAPNNRIIKYRQILLPLGDDSININAILGGMSYRVYEK